jgi:hypothetical protein
VERSQRKREGSLVTIPTGGLCAGIDRCHHALCDRVANVDFVLLRELAASAAFGVAACSPSG